MGDHTTRYPHFQNAGGRQSPVMAEFERLASAAWGGGKAKAAYDFMRVEVSSGGGKSQIKCISL